jgi:DNA-binding protein H-NS
MKQLTEEMMEEMKLRFSAIVEYEKRILAHQEEIKECNSSKNETLKELAKSLEATPSAIRKAVKEYMDSIKEKELYEEKEEVLAMLQEFGFFK